MRVFLPHLLPELFPADDAFASGSERSPVQKHHVIEHLWLSCQRPQNGPRKWNVVLAELLKEGIAKENACRQVVILVFFWERKRIGIEEPRQIGAFHDGHDEGLVTVGGLTFNGDAQTGNSAAQRESRS